MPRRNIARELEMANAYVRGETLQSIGARYGVSRQRVQQIVVRHGVNKTYSPRPLLNARRLMQEDSAKSAKRDDRCMKVYGCTFEQAVAINGKRPRSKEYQTVAGKYYHQMRNARQRGIEWKFTLPTWWAVWLESGKWEERGRGPGYCMGRYGDSGPYSPENVYICTIGENFSDSYLVKPAQDRALKRAANREQAVA